MIQRLGRRQRYQMLPHCLEALTARLVLRDKVIQPLLAAATDARPGHGSHNATRIEHCYETLRVGTQVLLQELGPGT